MEDNLKLKHIYNRIGFGIHPSVLSKFDTPQSSINELSAKLLYPRYQPIKFHLEGKEAIVELLANGQQLSPEQKGIRRRLLFELQKSWIESLHSPSPNALLEHMALFWHGHFACKTRDFRLASAYLEVLRSNALGNFRDLLFGIAKDAVMIKYLNNQQNVKGKPNENFGRELLELFTLGIGNYTENDIKEAARAFTGWSVDKNGKFSFRKNRFDGGKKKFLGKSGNFNGEDIIDIILEKREAAYFIAGKVYQYFVNHNRNEDLIRFMGDVLYDANYDFKELWSKILGGSWFFEKQNIGTKVKSPIELIASIQNLLLLKFEKSTNLLYLQRVLGQELFNPPNVAGWQRDLKWINNSTLSYRLNLSKIVLGKSDFDIRVKEEQEGFNFQKTNLNRFSTTKANYSSLVQKLRKNKIAPSLQFLLTPSAEFYPNTNSAKHSLEDVLELTCNPEFQFC